MEYGRSAYPTAPIRLPVGGNRSIRRRQLGLGTIVNLIYSLSPKHTDGYYAQRARDAAALRPDRICIKDPGGLLTPERTRTLVPAVLRNADGLPVEFHTHCITGLGPLCCLEAIKLGIKSVNTAIPPLADASSNPFAVQRHQECARAGVHTDRRCRAAQGRLGAFHRHCTA